MPKLNLNDRRWPPTPHAGDRVALMDAAMSRQWTGGKYTAEVEARMCEITGASYCVTFNSCTSAIHAVLAARVSHRILVPSFTFAGTITGAGHLGHRVEFLDVDPHTLNAVLPDWAALEDPTTTVLAVDLHGVPHDLPREQVVTDACQSIGTLAWNKHVGAEGTHCWSFSSAKLVSAPDGGAVTTNDNDEYMLLRTLRDYGIPPGESRSEAGVIRRDGHNWRPSELSLALVASRLDNLDSGVFREDGLRQRANRVGTMLHEAIDAAGLWRQQAPAGSTVAWHKIRIGPPDATRNPVGQVASARMRDLLHASGVPTHRWGRTPLHQHPAYRTGQNLPVTELAALNTFCLGTESCPPITWTDSEIAYVQGVIDEIGKALA